MFKVSGTFWCTKDDEINCSKCQSIRFSRFAGNLLVFFAGKVSHLAWCFFLCKTLWNCFHVLQICWTANISAINIYIFHSWKPYKFENIFHEVKCVVKFFRGFAHFGRSRMKKKIYHHSHLTSAMQYYIILYAKFRFLETCRKPKIFTFCEKILNKSCNKHFNE